MSTYLTCTSTQDDVICMAPVVHALEARGQQVQVLHVGMQLETTDGLFDFFNMKPAARVTLLRQAPRLAHLTAELVTRLDTYLQQMAPDVVLVQGDTTCALAASLAAAWQDVPVAHLEAGLRSADQASFPEDLNSSLIDRMALWHFTSTPQSHRNLLDEGISACRIHEAGNTTLDAAQWVRQRMENTCLKKRVPTDVLRFLRLHAHEQMLLVTAHQYDPWGRPMQRIAAAVAGLLQLHPKLTVVWPLPTSQALRADVQTGLACLPADARQRLCLTEALPFPAMVTLLDACCFTLTDSDSVQQLASALQKPVLGLREGITSKALVEAGGALVAGNMAQQIVELASELLSDPLLLTSMCLPESPFGDGRASHRIAEILSTQTQARLPAERMAA